MKEPKQVILIRNDLGMSPGKIGAQSAHASMAAIINRGEMNDDDQMVIDCTPEMKQWLTGPFVKICLRVKSEAELLKYYEKAQNAGLPRAIIKDEGRTEFHGTPTYTTMAIGPADPDEIDKITKSLQLF